MNPAVKNTNPEDFEKKGIDPDVNLLKSDTTEKGITTKAADDTKNLAKKTDKKEKLTKKEKTEHDNKYSTNKTASVDSE